MSNKCIRCISTINIISIIILNISMPLFIKSFQVNDADIFFPLLFNIISSLIFLPMFYYCFRSTTNIFCISCINHKKIMCTGFLWTISIILIVYASPIDRVPPDIQSVIYQLYFPLTFLVNMICGIPYKTEEYTILGFVSFGLMICIIPLIYNISNVSNYNLIWILVFTIGLLLDIISNVYQHIKIGNSIHFLSIMFYGKIYQIIFTVAFIWINFIKEIGNYESYSTWSIAFNKNIDCYFITCADSWYIGIINAISTNILILTIIYLISQVNASYIGLLNSIASPITIIIWYFIININIYRLIFEMVGIIFIIIGFIKYTNNLKKNEVINKIKMECIV